MLYRATDYVGFLPCHLMGSILHVIAVSTDSWHVAYANLHKIEV